MESKYGLIENPSFDAIFISSTKNRTNTVNYKTATAMFRGDMPSMVKVEDVLVIADNGVFLVEWDTKTYKFIHKLELSYNEISDAKSSTHERSLMPDSQYLEITTTNDSRYNFLILDETVDRAAKYIKTNL